MSLWGSVRSSVAHAQNRAGTTIQTVLLLKDRIEGMESGNTL